MGAMWSLLWGWWTAGTQVSSVQYAEDGDLGPEGDVADPTTGLTLRHRTAMVRTWDMVRPDMKVHGINFFLTLFRAEPELQTRFKGFADKTEEELKTNKRLAAHASTVMLAITGLVDNLDDVTCLVEMLNATALNHKRRGLPQPSTFTSLPSLFAPPPPALPPPLSSFPPLPSFSSLIPSLAAPFLLPTLRSQHFLSLLPPGTHSQPLLV
ncbi:hemoglobin [Penaeus vannamei]|uniref:Hemoglobin n=1 Tax=Penaeus vannamei TaxID=6689 RepID=A0A423U8B2_PENVA|nr:hemoglobin [Penaeus vannamei]